MLSWQQFLIGAAQNAARIRGYALGGDGENGTSDCIGLIIGALALNGVSWPGVHGTNYAARNRMRTLVPLREKTALFRGQILYKAREPGDSGYALPDAYRDSPDRRDYYHAGVVTSLQPLIITHCTDVPSGIRIDTSPDDWGWGGELDLVDYGGPGKDGALYRAAVTVSGNPYPVRLRSAPSTKASVLLSVPQGAVADVLEETSGEWAKIRVEGTVGYMMRQFLRPLAEGCAAVPRSELREWLGLAEKLQGGIRQALEG